VGCVTLDAYRSCSRDERRQVLGTFWRDESAPSPRVSEAAAEYGPPAIACLVVVLLELVLIDVVSSVHHSILLWIAIALQVFVLWTILYAVRRTGALRHRGAS